MSTAPTFPRPMGCEEGEAKAAAARADVGTGAPEPAPDQAIEFIRIRQEAPTRADMDTLAGLRVVRDLIKAKVEAAQDLLTDALAGELEMVRKLTDQIKVTEDSLKARAVALYGITAERRPAPGLQVKLWTVYDYDRRDAIAWSKKHAPHLVTEVLDEKGFEKAAEALSLPFVRITKEPRAQIDTDLRKALEKENAKPALQSTVKEVLAELGRREDQERTGVIESLEKAGEPVTAVVVGAPDGPR